MKQPSKQGVQKPGGMTPFKPKQKRLKVSFTVLVPENVTPGHLGEELREILEGAGINPVTVEVF